MNIKFIKWSVCATFLTSIVFAQEKKDSLRVTQLNEVVVSDTKFAQSKEKSGKIIDKITADDLQRRKGQSVATVLNQVAGVEINGNQTGNGMNVEYYIRGGRSRQVLIMIDGVPVTDASGSSMTYDLRLLPVDQVDSIEVMKGSSSTLYGSNAGTAVINITLKKARKENISGGAYFNLGTMNSVKDDKTSAQDFNQGFSFSAGSIKLTSYTSFNSTETTGLSEALGENFEIDHFSRVNALQKIGYQLTDKLSISSFFGYDKIKNKYDSGSFADEDKNSFLSEQFRTGLNSIYKYNKGELHINSSFSNLERLYNSYTAYNSTLNNYDYKSRHFNADVFNKYVINKQLFFVLGGQFQFMDMNNVTTPSSIYTVNVLNKNTKFNMIDPYTTFVYNSDFGLNVNVGARLNMHNVYGENLTYNINPSYKIKNLPVRILSSLSTAFITPSLYQLFSQYGNSELKPEENTTVEVGFETELLNKKVVINAVGFYRESKNRVDFYTNPVTFTSNYINNDLLVNTKGIETNVTIFPIKNVQLTGNYTYLQFSEEENIRLPKHKANASIGVNFTKRIQWNAQYQYVDQRADRYYDSATFSSKNVVLSSYQLVHTNISFDILPNRLSVFGAVNNLFNEDFVEVSGFTTRGRNFKLGLNLQF